MIVIDACVAVKWFLPEPLSEAADAAERWDATLVTADGGLVRQLSSARWTGRIHLLGT